MYVVLVFLATISLRIIKYSAVGVIKTLGFLVNNVYVVFTGQVFQQKVGNPVAISYIPLLVNISLRVCGGIDKKRIYSLHKNLHSRVHGRCSVSE